MAIHIYFRGLICLYGQTFARATQRKTKSNALLIREGHAPHISIKGSAPVPTVVVSRDIIFSPSGKAKVSPLFDQHVPHIETLTHNTVVLKPGTTPKIVLPEGELTVASYFKYGAIFDLDDDNTTLECVAETTILIAKNSVLTVSFNGDDHQLSGDDCVFIENASQSDPKHPGDHFKLHGNILSGTQADLALYSPGQKAPNCDSPFPGNCLSFCDEVSRDVKNKARLVERAATTSECTNSQWP